MCESGEIRRDSERIAGKTFITYICFYVVAAALAGAAAYFVKTMGWFDVQLPNEMVTEAVTMEGYNRW